MTVFELEKHLHKELDETIVSFDRLTDIEPDRTFYEYTFVTETDNKKYYDEIIDKYDGITIYCDCNKIGSITYNVFMTRFYLERFDGSGLGYLTAQEINEGKLK